MERFARIPRHMKNPERQMKGEGGEVGERNFLLLAYNTNPEEGMAVRLYTREDRESAAFLCRPRTQQQRKSSDSSKESNSAHPTHQMRSCLASDKPT